MLKGNPPAAALKAPLGALSARTRLTAIFGDPVEHSLSPAMHNAAYAALKMDRIYVAFHVKAEQLPGAVRSIPALGLLGINLTVPHKERAIRLVGRVSEEARLLGAINCIVNRRNELCGDNTDARGLEMDLRALKATLRGELAIVVGAGGGAAAATLACLRTGARRIVLANRTPGRALDLSRRFADHRARARRAAEPQIEARGLDALRDRHLLSEAAIVINATPMGLTSSRFAALDYGASPPDCLFYDLIYASEPTAFLKGAIALGRRAVDGAGMLVTQGELAFRLFNGVAPPKGVMRRALMKELGRRCD